MDLSLVVTILGVGVFMLGLVAFTLIYKEIKVERLKLVWLGVLLLLLVVAGRYAYLIVELSRTDVSYGIIQIGVNAFLNYSFLFTVITLLFLVIIKKINNRNQALAILQRNLEKYNADLEAEVEARTQVITKSHRRALKKERELQKLKDEFVFIAAHELRNPITATKWNLELLKDSPKFNKLPKKDIHLIDNVKTSNDRLINLVSDLLKVARLETKTVRINRDNVNIKEVMKPIIQEVDSLLNKKKLKLKTKIDPKLDKIKIDVCRFKEVLLNLIDNAIKYSPAGKKIEIDLKKKGSKIQVSVIDEGIGINESDLAKLFTKFFRSESEEVQNEIGTGLGLYIIKKLVKGMKGEIIAKSKGVGKGSSFIFTLPIK